MKHPMECLSTMYAPGLALPTFNEAVFIAALKKPRPEGLKGGKAGNHFSLAFPEAC